MQRVGLLVLAAAALCCILAVPALANVSYVDGVYHPVGTATAFMTLSATATTPPVATWSPGSLYVFLEPYILSAFGAIFSILLAWLCSILKAKFNLDVSNAQQANLQQTAMNAAGRIMASQEAKFATAQINVGSPLIAAELPKVMNNAQDAIKALGLTPDRVSNLIQAKVGILQTQAMSGPAVVAVVPTEKKVS